MSRSNNQNETKQKQIQRYKDVIKHLSKLRIKRKQILNAINKKLKPYYEGTIEPDTTFEILHNIDNSTLSEFNRGQNIPKEFLEVLYEEYYINPEYIRGKSDWMIDICAEEIDPIIAKGSIKPSFVVSGNTDGTERKYLALEMKEYLYEYLITISPEKLTSSEKIELSSKEREKIEEIFKKSKDSEYSQYILMPYDRIIKRKLMTNPINFESELSLLLQDYKVLEERVNKLSSISEEEISTIISEINEKIDKIKKLSNKYKTQKNS